ncbi:MAG: hypothetical protein AAGC79_03885 [Pseudomonadota bacterium]
MTRAFLTALLISGCTASAPVPQDPLQGEPILFALPSDIETVVDRLLILTPNGPQGAPIPRAARHARNEDRIDLSITPVLGPLFGGQRITPGDAKRDGFELGQVYFSGTALIVDLRQGDAGMLEREVTVATLLEPAQPIRYDLGRLSWRDVPSPEVLREPVGVAYILDDRFVVVSQDSVPGLGDIYDLLTTD